LLVCCHHARRPRLFDTFVVPPERAQQVIEELALAVVTGNISCNFFMNPHFIQAHKLVGIELPSRKVLVSQYLPLLSD
jgi:hypothetical protein